MNILKYCVMNDGEVLHEDWIDDHIDESNDFTWPNTYYEVNIDLLPDDLKDADDETLAPIILAYHHKQITKPEWII